MPKWCAISCTTVMCTSSITSSIVSQMARSAAGRSGSGPAAPRVELAPLGQRDALVEPQQLRAVGGRVVLDHDHAVVDHRRQLVGDLVQRP